jgi:hypothetical protein
VAVAAAGYLPTVSNGTQTGPRIGIQ